MTPRPTPAEALLTRLLPPPEAAAATDNPRAPEACETPRGSDAPAAEKPRRAGGPVVGADPVRPEPDVDERRRADAPQPCPVSLVREPAPAVSAAPGDRGTPRGSDAPAAETPRRAGGPVGGADPVRPEPDVDERRRADAPQPCPVSLVREPALDKRPARAPEAGGESVVRPAQEPDVLGAPVVAAVSLVRQPPPAVAAALAAEGLGLAEPGARGESLARRPADAGSAVPELRPPGDSGPGAVFLAGRPADAESVAAGTRPGDVVGARAESVVRVGPESGGGARRAGDDVRVGAGPVRKDEVRRRGPADPVRGVMHRHEVLVAGAVDEWEVAAGLEAHGVTDGDARRLRHRDVFGLAEELYARVPRAVRPVDAGEGAGERAVLPPRTALIQLAPGAACALAAAVRLPAAGALLAVLVAVATWAALRRGPLRVARGGGAAAWTYGLLGFALCGPQAVTAIRGDGPYDAGAGTATFTALAFALLPAAYCAHWLAVRSRAQLAPSHGLSDFADAVRPRLAAALAAYAAALFVLLRIATAVAGPAPLAAPLALGLLLFTARLLAVHGFPAQGAAGLAAACVTEALTLAAAPLHLGPGGAAAEALFCGAAALALTVQAFRTLARAAAHRPPPRRP